MTKKNDKPSTPEEEEQSRSKHKGEFPSRKHQFKKGQTGNPNGRPKGSGLTDQLKKILREKDPSDPKGEVTVAQRLIEAAVLHAKDGDLKFFQEIFNRVEGKVPDRIVGAFNHGIMDELEDSDLQEIIEAGKLRESE